MYTDRREVEESIVTTIENGAVEDARAEYDVEAIAEETFEYSQDLQKYVQTVDVDDFWAAVERYAR